MSLIILSCLLVPGLAVAAQARTAPSTPAGSPVSVITELHETLLKVMKQARQLGYTGRYETLKPVISTSYDFSAIARTVLAGHWSDLSDAQRQHFVDTFRRLTIATYASRFDGYAGQQFKMMGLHDAARGRKLVRSQLVGPGGETHDFDYLLHSSNGRWRILNVVVDGVSDLALKRSQYGSIITKGGFDALIQALDRKLSQYRKG